MSSFIWECGNCRKQDRLPSTTLLGEHGRDHTCRPSDLLKYAANVYRDRGFPGDTIIADWLRSEAGQVSGLADDTNLGSCDDPDTTRTALQIARAITEAAS